MQYPDKDFFFCRNELGHPIFTALSSVTLLISVLQTLPSFYQISIQIKQLCKLKEVDSVYQEFKSIFEEETVTYGTAITAPQPDKSRNSFRSFHDVRKNKQRRSMSFSRDLRNGNTQEISDNSRNSSDNCVDPSNMPRSISHNSQEVL